MVIQYVISIYDVILAREFKKNLYHAAYKHGVIDEGKYKKNGQVNENI